jgi:pyruvate dehydrogenase E2 component (dihydrolipoamide acetyltransferase)
MAEIVMPRLSDTMEEGTILRWLKRDGEEVRRGEELVEIETDKATMNYESDRDGVLEILAGEGDTLAVGALIARVGGRHDGAGADGTQPSERAAVAQATSTSDASPPSSDASQSAPAAAARGPEPDGERVKASPLARRIAQENGVDLRTLRGSGPGGRIVKADVHAVGDAAPATAGAAAGAAGAAGAARDAIATAKGETTVLELSRTQQTIARRMAESKATIPDFSLQIEVDMEACVELRTELKRLSQPKAPTDPDTRGDGETPTYNDMVLKACALALREHPRANGSYRDGRLQSYSRMNVGVAVAAESALVVPTVFDADEKSLGEIARETRALAERVRAGTITPPELGGGTFTVSNLGMYGIKSFNAIINPPQAAILSVGAVQPRPVARDGALLARHMMDMTLVCDHRILYGADAALFLARIRELLERPAALTL